MNMAKGYRVGNAFTIQSKGKEDKHTEDSYNRRWGWNKVSTELVKCYGLCAAAQETGLKVRAACVQSLFHHSVVLNILGKTC